MALPSVDVAVVGAANVDLVVHVPRFPTAGETVFASALRTLPGGKGLNQAVAVVHFGGTATLIARIGDDTWGQLLHDALVAAGVDITGTIRVPGSVTAAAIVHVPTVPDIDAAATTLARAAVTVI